MVTRRDLRNPPITEALVDLRATPTRPLGPDVLDLLRSRLETRFPRSQEFRSFEASLKIAPGEAPVPGGADRGLHGYFLETAEGSAPKEVAQFRVDGFTYNRLKPYPGGEALLAEALKLWQIYVEIVAPSLVTRTALRYINHLRLPGRASFGQYLSQPPAMPPEVSGPLQSFLTRVKAHDESSGLSTVVTESCEQALDPNTVTVLLDIDVFRIADLGPTLEDLRPTLDALRERKNEAFFGIITEETVRLFE